MKYLVVGSGPIKEKLFWEEFDEVIFINAGIEHFYKVNSPKKIWVTKPSFFQKKEYKGSLINIEVRSRKKKILNFIDSKLINNLSSIFLISRNSNLPNIDLLRARDKDHKYEILDYGFINKILRKHLGFFYWIKVIKCKPKNILKLFIPRNISRIIKGYGPPRFLKASTGALCFLIMNEMKWNFDKSHEIFTQGITNPSEGSYKYVSKKARVYFINSKEFKLDSNHIYDHYFMDKMCFSSLRKLNIIW